MASANSPRIIDGLPDLLALEGQSMGTSDWVTVDQSMIDEFARVTGDLQWIHIDPERAEAESPYGGTVAHGFLTLSLLPALTAEVYRVDGAKMMINYGVNKVRFPQPLRAGERVRAEVRLASVREVGPRVEIVTTVTFEAEGQAKPVCVAESIRLFVPARDNAS